MQSNTAEKYYKQIKYPESTKAGNVITVVSDRLLSDGPNANGKVNQFQAETCAESNRSIVRYSDYYPFGFTMDDRKGSYADYRYGFNGMEKDDEVIGDGNSYTTEFRTIDVRIGRWWSRDPVTHEFQSPYCTFDNNPIYYKDPSGADGEEPSELEETYVSEDDTFEEVQEKIINDFSTIEGVSIKSDYKELNNPDGTALKEGKLRIYDKSDKLVGEVTYNNGKWTTSMPEINNPGNMIAYQGLPPGLTGSEEPMVPVIADGSNLNSTANVPDPRVNDGMILNGPIVDPPQLDDNGVGMSLAGTMWENAAKDAVKSVKSGAKGIKGMKYIARGSKAFGLIGSGVSFGIDLYNIKNDPSAKNYASLAVNTTATVLMFFPPVGTAIGVGLTIFDMSGGTDAVVDYIKGD